MAANFKTLRSVSDVSEIETLSNARVHHFPDPNIKTQNGKPVKVSFSLVFNPDEGKPVLVANLHANSQENQDEELELIKKQLEIYKNQIKTDLHIDLEDYMVMGDYNQNILQIDAASKITLHTGDANYQAKKNETASSIDSNTNGILRHIVKKLGSEETIQDIAIPTGLQEKQRGEEAGAANVYSNPQIDKEKKKILNDSKDFILRFKFTAPAVPDGQTPVNNFNRLAAEIAQKLEENPLDCVNFLNIGTNFRDHFGSTIMYLYNIAFKIDSYIPTAGVKGLSEPKEFYTEEALQNPAAIATAQKASTRKIYEIFHALLGLETFTNPLLTYDDVQNSLKTLNTGFRDFADKVDVKSTIDNLVSDYSDFLQAQDKLSKDAKNAAEKVVADAKDAQTQADADYQNLKAISEDLRTKATKAAEEDAGVQAGGDDNAKAASLKKKTEAETAAKEAEEKTAQALAAIDIPKKAQVKALKYKTDNVDPKLSAFDTAFAAFKVEMKPVIELDAEIKALDTQIKTVTIEAQAKQQAYDTEADPTAKNGLLPALQAAQQIVNDKNAEMQIKLNAMKDMHKTIETAYAKMTDAKNALGKFLAKGRDFEYEIDPVNLPRSEALLNLVHKGLTQWKESSEYKEALKFLKPEKQSHEDTNDILENCGVEQQVQYILNGLVVYEANASGKQYYEKNADGSKGKEMPKKDKDIPLAITETLRPTPGNPPKNLANRIFQTFGQTQLQQMSGGYPKMNGHLYPGRKLVDQIHAKTTMDRVKELSRGRFYISNTEAGGKGKTVCKAPSFHTLMEASIVTAPFEMWINDLEPFTHGKESPVADALTLLIKAYKDAFVADIDSDETYNSSQDLLSYLGKNKAMVSEDLTNVLSTMQEEILSHYKDKNQVAKSLDIDSNFFISTKDALAQMKTHVDTLLADNATLIHAYEAQMKSLYDSFSTLRNYGSTLDAHYKRPCVAVADRLEEELSKFIKNSTSYSNQEDLAEEITNLQDRLTWIAHSQDGIMKEERYYGNLIKEICLGIVTVGILHAVKAVATKIIDGEWNARFFQNTKRMQHVHEVDNRIELATAAPAA